MSEVTEQIIKWFEKADHDFGTAIITHKHLPNYRDTIAFHCQQAVEKYLKAYLLKLGAVIVKTHDLVYLLELINKEEHLDNTWFEKMAMLQEFSVEIRYPDEQIELSDENINLALQIAGEVRELILSKTGITYPFKMN
jgi:HEPN domain-containing protein